MNDDRPNCRCHGPKSPKKYFVTVERCDDGHRGVFCSKEGHTLVQDRPHTDEQILEAVGVFALVLSPRSEAFSEDEVKEMTRFRPLKEFRGRWGIALRDTEKKGI